MYGENKSSASVTFFKVLLYMSNVFLLVGSIAMIVSLLFIMVNGKEYIDLMGNNSTWIIACVVVTVASFMFFISVLGCCGAAGKNMCMLKLYISIVSSLLVVLVAGGVLAWMYKDDAISKVGESMKIKMRDYSPGRTDDSTRVWDDIQKHLQCCGINNVYDWAKFSDSYRNADVLKYPTSCEQEQLGRTGRTESNVNVDGCLVKIADILRHNLWKIGGVIATVFLYLLLSVCVVCMLIKSVNDLDRKKMLPEKQGLVNEGGPTNKCILSFK
ncbi:unnamed protein product [Meganyctiphanes norvegica]|uniref:Tetraspanin n=1 Tax=Meganyctiphanes norvegica TaxID=48144 RepID=A0AAV2PLF2_MEGNR